MTAKKKTFEERLDEVESLIGDMEKGGMTLETSMRRYEEGMKLIRSLEDELKDATQRLTVLREGGEKPPEAAEPEEKA